MACGTSTGNLRVRNQRSYRRNAQGTARPFLMGFNNPMLLPSDSFQMQAFTEVSGIPLEKTENTTFTMPSDDDPFTLEEITSGYGGLQNQTFTLTEYMDERQNTPYLAGVRRNLPFAIWVPQGRGRQLADPHDFTSGTLVSLANASADNQDDNFNPSDGDPANANKISINCNNHGRYRHTIRQASFVAESDQTYPTAQGVMGAAFLEEQDEMGAKIYRKFMLEDKASGNGEQAKLHWTDKFNVWQTFNLFGPTTGATNYKYRKCIIAGAHVITLFATGAANAAGANNGSWVFNLSSLTDAPTNIGSSEWGVNAAPWDVFALTPTSIFYVGGNNAASGEAKILCASGALETPTDVTPSGVAAATCFYSVHGRGEQLVVGGGTGTSAAAATPLIYVSNDFGDSFTVVQSPTGIAAGAITAVYMIAKDAFWIGTATGQLYFTYDFGKTWTTGNNKTSAISSAGLKSISNIAFVEPSGGQRADLVGYLLGTTAAQGTAGQLRIARTIDGGNTWHTGGSYIDKQPTSVSATDTIWGDLAVADAQTVLAVGTGRSATEKDSVALVEYE